MKEALKEASNLGIERKGIKAAIRSASVTAIGPSLSPVITLLSLVAVIGAPTTWMRLCDVGAARTELGVISLTSNLSGVEVGSAAFGAEAFSYALWGMALNNLGWLFVVFILGHRMRGIVEKMNMKYNPTWVKKLLAGATVGLFAYLLSNQIKTFEIPKLTPAIISAIVMLVLTTLFKKNQRLQELSLGIAMLIGMFGTQIILS
ncbi:membrane protein [Clostridioides difficile]|nr:membrane protein [Clostridioides difficile]